MENKITVKAKKRYFRINRFVVTIRRIWIGPIVILILFSMAFPENIIDCPWKTIPTILLAGLFLICVYVCLEWWFDVDLVQNKKELNECFNWNEEIIKNLQDKINSQEQSIRQVNKLDKKIKKIRMKNDQIQISLKVIDM